MHRSAGGDDHRVGVVDRVSRGDPYTATRRALDGGGLRARDDLHARPLGRDAQTVHELLPAAVEIEHTVGERTHRLRDRGVGRDRLEAVAVRRDACRHRDDRACVRMRHLLVDPPAHRPTRRVGAQHALRVADGAPELQLGAWAHERRLDRVQGCAGQEVDAAAQAPVASQRRALAAWLDAEVPQHVDAAVPGVQRVRALVEQEAALDRRGARPAPFVLPRLDQRDRAAPFGRGRRRRQPGEPATDHHDLALAHPGSPRRRTQPPDEVGPPPVTRQKIERCLRRPCRGDP